MARGGTATTGPRPRTRSRTANGGNAGATAPPEERAGSNAGTRSTPPEGLGERIRGAGERVWDFVEERPLTAGAVGIALGLLGGLILPATRPENELMGGPRDQLLGEARKRVKKTVKRGKQAARTALEVAKDELGPED